MARRGARTLRTDGDDVRPDRSWAPKSSPPSPQERWVDTGPVEDGGGSSPLRHEPGNGPGGARLPAEVADELKARIGPGTAARDAKRLQDAARAYERDRYQEARRLLEPLSRRAPDVAAVRELHGLTLYRMGRWRAAIAQLEAAERLTGSLEQHPVLADCHRALRHFDAVDRLWNELRRDGAPAAVVAEGRIVAAGALADRGRVTEAVRLLEQAPVEVRKPRLHHLRLWYALAALCERSGDVPRARELFRRVSEAAPDLADATQRYRALT